MPSAHPHQWRASGPRTRREHSSSQRLVVDGIRIDLPLVCIAGDRCFQMTCGELAVAKREKLRSRSPARRPLVEPDQGEAGAACARILRDRVFRTMTTRNRRRTTMVAVHNSMLSRVLQRDCGQDLIPKALKSTHCVPFTSRCATSRCDTVQDQATCKM